MTPRCVQPPQLLKCHKVLWSCHFPAITPGYCVFYFWVVSLAGIQSCHADTVGLDFTALLMCRAASQGERCLFRGESLPIFQSTVHLFVIVSDFPVFLCAVFQRCQRVHGLPKKPARCHSKKIQLWSDKQPTQTGGSHSGVHGKPIERYEYMCVCILQIKINNFFFGTVCP